MANLPTHRDIADFFELALRQYVRGSTVVDLRTIVDWADKVLEMSDSTAEWMIELSMATDQESVVYWLRRVPGNVFQSKGGQILVAYIAREWRAGRIDREQTACLLTQIRDELPEEYDIPLVVPSAILDDEVSCIAQGQPQQLNRVDDALRDVFSLFQQYEDWIPRTPSRD